jgi:hypothetical protein
MIVSHLLTQMPDPPSARRRDGSLSRALEALVMRALAKSRDQRPPTAAAFAEELARAALDPSAPSGRPSSAEEETLVASGRWVPAAASRRRRLRRFLAGAFPALAVAAVLGVRASPPMRWHGTPVALAIGAHAAPQPESIEAPLAEASRLLDEGKIAEACRLVRSVVARFERDPALQRFLDGYLRRLARAAEP